MKIINDRCPLADECEKKMCHYIRRELDCIYYRTNARPGCNIEDQEELRRQKDRAAAEADWLAKMEDDEENEEDGGGQHLTPAHNRTLEQVAAEIKTFTAAMLNNIIEIGRRMVEAKEMVPYGQFGSWIKENTDYSVSTANNFMRLYEEYGASQGTLFGDNLNCQTFGKLSYTKALALLSVPREEREEFVQTHDVKDMSTRELQKTIKELEEVKKERDKALQDSEGTALRMAALEDKLAEQQDQAEDLAEARNALKEAESRAAQLERDLKELQERPVEVAVQEPDPAAVQQAVNKVLDTERAKMAEATAAAVKKAETDLEMARQETKKLRERVKVAEEKAASAAFDEKAKAEAAVKEAEDLRRELAMSDPVTAEFRALFGQLAQLSASLVEMLDKVPKANREKLANGLHAVGNQLLTAEVVDISLGVVGDKK